jgi:5-methylcytosine-specific restriction endonuclease McrA
MPRRRWTDQDIRTAAQAATSIRGVIQAVGLVPAGGNYQQITEAIRRLNCDTSHFTGKGWNKNKSGRFLPRIPLEKILTKESSFQSHKLKRRLFAEHVLTEKCSMCGWNKAAPDGRIPLELDHINGDRHDNRIENLRILCPNCHSLQPTHRGKNKKRPG